MPAGHGLDRLTWEDIRLIGAIAETGSLPEAAVRLGTHHSTVSPDLNTEPDSSPSSRSEDGSSGR